MDATDQTTITVHIPMTFTVRGGRKTILSDAVPAPPQPRIDNALLKALARAHRWRRMIESGKFASITELAKAEDVNQSYACRILRLSLLAPSIVTTILNGRHDSDVMLKKLMEPLPVRWDEQTATLKLGDRSSAIMEHSRPLCAVGRHSLTEKQISMKTYGAHS
jgi:hypothetical protein